MVFTFWSSLLKIDVLKSRKHRRERCHFDHVCDVINKAGIGGSPVHYVTNKPVSVHTWYESESTRLRPE